MNTLEVKVVRKAREADDICSIELEATDGLPLPVFTAGAHIDVHLGAGLVRQYSLCSGPQHGERYLIGVLRDPASRGGSQAVHDDLAVGSVVRISAPKNHFPLVAAQRSLLLAGGIGVTPILAMAETLARDGRQFEMHYCSRAPERTAFRERIAGSAYAGQVHFHFDTGAPGQRLDLAALLAEADPQTHIYVCGPGGFIEHVKTTAQAQGWPAAQVHFEYFGAAPVDTGGDVAFEVRLASSGRVIAIPADRSVASVLMELGVDLPVSCEQGVCGTCLTRVLGGAPDHRDMYLTDEEHAANDQFTPCCSRAKSAQLMLDL